MASAEIRPSRPFASAEILPYRSFDITIAEARQSLEEHGVAVIPNVLDDDQTQAMRAGMWDLLRHLSSKMSPSIIEDDRSTWHTYDQLKPMHGMLLQGYGVGHSQLAWNVRQAPLVAHAFAEIWQCEVNELVTSYDGMSINFPPEIVGDAGFHTSDWFHVDQSYSRPSFECIQGMVTAYDVLPGDATLSILEGSHKFSSEFGKVFPQARENLGDWYMMKDRHMKFYKDRGCERVNVQADAGSLILWDSRTVHCGCLPQRGREQQSIRFVTYVCQMPRSRFDDRSIARKRTMFNRREMTSHWPDGRRVFTGRDRTDTVPLPRPTLTPLGRTLAGFDV